MKNIISYNMGIDIKKIKFTNEYEN